MGLHEALRNRGLDVRAGVTSDGFDGVTPRLVIRATSTAQVSDALRCATEYQAVVAVRGHGTKAQWGHPAPETNLMLDLSAMDSVLDHQPGDLIVQVQAGAAVSAVQDVVASAGQRLLIDDLSGDSSIGGLISANVTGPHRVVAGTVRDTLIGLTFVRADGTVAHAGGKVVKNVAGYDLCKLLIGAQGTLAVITEATFRLHPQAECSQWLAAEVTLADLEVTLRELNDSQLAPSAIDLNAEPGAPVALAVLLEGTGVGVAARVRELDAILAMRQVPTPAWTQRYPYSVTDLGLKLTCQLSSVTDLVRAATARNVAVRGSAGSGVLFGRLPEDPGAAETLLRLREVAGSAGGSVVVQHGPRSARTQLDVWGPISGLEVMRRIKHQFDPANLLSPSRFVGGI